MCRIAAATRLMLAHRISWPSINNANYVTETINVTQNSKCDSTNLFSSLSFFPSLFPLFLFFFFFFLSFLLHFLFFSRWKNTENDTESAIALPATAGDETIAMTRAGREEGLAYVCVCMFNIQFPRRQSLNKLPVISTVFQHGAHLISRLFHTAARKRALLSVVRTRVPKIPWYRSIRCTVHSMNILLHRCV